MTDTDRFAHFLDAQRESWPQALAELGRGVKASHWMWFIFPQIAGLGHSAMARRYALSSIEEARAYLAHRVLGARLREATSAAITAPGSAERIFGGIDSMKLRSSLTLFALATTEDTIFQDAIDRFFAGKRDPETLRRT